MNRLSFMACTLLHSGSIDVVVNVVVDVTSVSQKWSLVSSSRTKLKNEYFLKPSSSLSKFLQYLKVLCTDTDSCQLVQPRNAASATCTY